MLAVLGSPPIELHINFVESFRGHTLYLLFFVDAGLDAGARDFVGILNAFWGRLGCSCLECFVTVATSILGEVDDGLEMLAKWTPE